MSKEAPTDHPFEPRFVELLGTMFERQVAFNEVLGMKLTSYNPQRAACRIEMRDELIGHFLHKRLHGGVISATLDAMGGFALMLAIGARHLDETVEARLMRFAKLGTIDLRVDYLRPAVGPYFIAYAEVLRLGSRVASTRMEMHDADDRLVATAGAAYIVS